MTLYGNWNLYPYFVDIILFTDSIDFYKYWHDYQVGDFLDNLVNYDKENIPDTSLKAVEPYLNSPEFDPEFIKAKSFAAAGLCSWVINIVA